MSTEKQTTVSCDAAAPDSPADESSSCLTSPRRRHSLHILVMLCVRVACPSQPARTHNRAAACPPPLLLPLPLPLPLPAALCLLQVKKGLFSDEVKQTEVSTGPGAAIKQGLSNVAEGISNAFGGSSSSTGATTTSAAPASGSSTIKETKTTTSKF